MIHGGEVRNMTFKFSNCKKLHSSSLFCENMGDMLAEICPFSRNFMKYYFLMTS